MTENEFRDNLKVLGESEKVIKEHIELYDKLKKINPNYTYDRLYQRFIKTLEESRGRQGTVTLDGGIR